jgi:5-formyltetrahydrofolate cyclo-ligase
VYLTVGSELPTAPLITLARHRGWRLHVPVLRPGRTPALWFVPLEEPLRVNRYDIPEPIGRHRRVAPRWLDLVFVPLLAFASDGQRLGSGAGFYDRTFAYLRSRGRWRRPPLVGLAFESQRIDHLDAQPWDVPLDAVVTERTIHRFGS